MPNKECVKLLGKIRSRRSVEALLSKTLLQNKTQPVEKKGSLNWSKSKGKKGFGNKEVQVSGPVLGVEQKLPI